MNYTGRAYKWRSHPKLRSGSAALVLILALVLLVGTFAATVTRNVANERRSISDQATVKILESAIESVAGFDGQPPASLLLPIDDATDRRVLVETVQTGTEGHDNDSTAGFRATLLTGDRVGLSIVRKKEIRR